MNIQAITGVESNNQYFNSTKSIHFQGNLLKTGNDLIEISIPKAEKGGVNLISKTKKFFEKILRKGKLEPADNPIIAEMSRKSWYNDAGEKLNDIYLDLKSNDQYTGHVKDNIESYKKLPQVIKDALKPNDVDYYGHISQCKINQLYEIAKDAKRIPAYSYPPTFKGDTEEMLNNALNSNEYGISLNTNDISKIDLISDIKTDELSEGFTAISTDSKGAVIEETLLEGTDLESVTSSIHENLSENLHEGFDTSSLIDAAKEQVMDLGETIAEFAKGLIGHS